MHRSWSRYLDEPSEELQRAKKRAEESGRDLVPREREILRVLRMNRRKVKVVILGQDPYHTVIDGVPQATGLAFSIRDGLPIQPSLRNIYREIAYHWDVPSNPRTDLSWLCEQGVLLLNTSLTTEEGKAGEHIDIWKGFTHRVCRVLAERSRGIVWIVWGAKAHALAREVVDPQRDYLVTTSHPSPLSSARPMKGKDYQTGAPRTWPAFSGADVFHLVNTYLESLDHEAVDWTVPSMT